jgi:DNA-binding NarL/FixJ family response regulator
MRVLIVDDHRIVASGCRALFADDPEIDILEASDAESGERVFGEQHPDICVLDINLPTVSGLNWHGASSRATRLHVSSCSA